MRTRPTAPYVVGLALSVLMLYGAMWLPAINGPHLWLGLPSLVVWTGVWMVVVMVVLVRLERCLRRREDGDQQ